MANRIQISGVLVLAVLLSSLATGSATAGDPTDRERVLLPKVLTRYGFGDPNVPVRIVYTARIGKSNDAHPTTTDGKPLPRETLWVFDDPTPVWRVLAGATTRRFRKDMFPGADARLILRVGKTGHSRSLFFHFRQGWGSISVREGRSYGGGDWEFDPAADVSLVKLLSRTEPTAIGAPVLWTKVVGYSGGVTPVGVMTRVVRSHEAYADLTQDFGRHYDFDKSFVPSKHVEFGRDAVVAVWMPKRDTKDHIDWSNGRIHGEALRWEIRMKNGDKPARGWSPGIFGAFTLTPEVKRIHVVLDGELVSDILLDGNLEYRPDTPYARIVLRDADAPDAAEVFLWRGGAYRWCDAGLLGSEGTDRRGVLPSPVREAISDPELLGAASVELGVLNLVVPATEQAEWPEAVQALFRYLREAHPAGT